MPATVSAAPKVPSYASVAGTRSADSCLMPLLVPLDPVAHAIELPHDELGWHAQRHHDGEDGPRIERPARHRLGGPAQPRAAGAAGGLGEGDLARPVRVAGGRELGVAA